MGYTSMRESRSVSPARGRSRSLPSALVRGVKVRKRKAPAVLRGWVVTRRGVGS